MAFPTVQGTRTVSSTDAASTSHTVTLPTGIQAGELLLVFFGTGDLAADPVVQWPAGWTQFFEELETAFNANLAGAYRLADGGEGSSITVTTTTSCASAHIAVRISGAEDPATQVPEAASTEGTSATPDPPNLTPTGGPKDFLWIAACAVENSPAITAAPSSYTDLTTRGDPTEVEVGFAERDLNATSENPGGFTTTSNLWAAATIAVHPGGPVAAPPDYYGEFPKAKIADQARLGA